MGDTTILRTRFSPNDIVRRTGRILLILIWGGASACGDGVTSPDRLGSLFIPSDAASQEGNAQNYSPFSGPARRFQTLYAESELGDLPVGARITGIRFRMDAFASVAIEGDVSNFEIRLSTFPRGHQGLDPVFAENRGSNEVIVRTGPLVIAPGDYPIGRAPNAFGPVIEFQEPFTYPGGPLVLEIGTTGIAVGSTMDGVFPVNGIQSGYGSENGFDTPTADLGIYADFIVVEYRFIRP